MTGNEIVAEAFAAFERWCLENSDELEGLDVLEQVQLYYEIVD